MRTKKYDEWIYVNSQIKKIKKDEKDPSMGIPFILHEDKAIFSFREKGFPW